MFVSTCSKGNWHRCRVGHQDPEAVQTFELAEWEVRRKLGFLPKPGRIELITGRGPSIHPNLKDGDIAWIDTNYNAKGPESGAFGQ